MLSKLLAMLAIRTQIEARYDELTALHGFEFVKALRIATKFRVIGLMNRDEIVHVALKELAGEVMTPLVKDEDRPLILKYATEIAAMTEPKTACDCPACQTQAAARANQEKIDAMNGVANMLMGVTRH